VVRPPLKSKMGLAETTPKSLRGGSVAPVWPGGGFGHRRLDRLAMAKPPPWLLEVVAQNEKKKKKKKNYY
jgi:hypothetical protein